MADAQRDGLTEEVHRQRASQRVRTARMMSKERHEKTPSSLAPHGRQPQPATAAAIDGRFSTGKMWDTVSSVGKSWYRDMWCAFEA